MGRNLASRNFLRVRHSPARCHFQHHHFDVLLELSFLLMKLNPITNIIIDYSPHNPQSWSQSQLPVSLFSVSFVSLTKAWTLVCLKMLGPPAGKSVPGIFVCFDISGSIPSSSVIFIEDSGQSFVTLTRKPTGLKHLVQAGQDSTGQVPNSTHCQKKRI